jgi:hypothetical protein
MGIAFQFPHSFVTHYLQEPAIAVVTHTRREPSLYARFLLLGVKTRDESRSSDAFARTTEVAEEEGVCKVGERGEVIERESKGK